MNKNTLNKKWLFFTIPAAIATAVLSGGLIFFGVAIGGTGFQHCIGEFGVFLALLFFVLVLSCMSIIVVIVVLMVLGLRRSSTKLGKAIFASGIVLLISSVLFFPLIILFQLGC